MQVIAEVTWDSLARLIAIEEIKQLKARYFRFVDTRDYDGWRKFSAAMQYLTVPMADASGSPMAPGGSEISPITRGRDAIVAWIRDSFRTLTGTHHGHCHEVTIDSDTEAHGIIAMEDYIRSLDRGTKILQGTGHYHERYRVEDGVWRIAETRLTRLFFDVL